MRRGHHVGARFVEHCAPFRGRWLGAQAEEGEARGGQDRGADAHGQVHDDRGNRSRQQVAQHDDAIGSADRAYRFDIGLVLQGQHIAAHQAGKGRDAENRHGDDDVAHAGTENGNDADGQQNARKGKQHVGHAHHDPVPPAFVVTGEHAECGADERTGSDRDETGGQRDARAHQDATENIAPHGIDAEPVRCRGRCVQHVVVEKVFRVERHQPRGQQSHQHEKQDEPAGDQRNPLTLEFAPELGCRGAHGLRCARGIRAWWHHLKRMVGLMTA